MNFYHLDDLDVTLFNAKHFLAQTELHLTFFTAANTIETDSWKKSQRPQVNREKH